MYFLMSECTADPVDGASLTSDPTADAMESAPEVALSMLLVLVLVPPFGDKGGAPLLARRIVTGSVELLENVRMASSLDGACGAAVC
mmetsp:Transcript_20572/g.61930  ORF Transcript_20572/g.61930 Transcript_20572/m.61930 type:complete len:87 (+) Transcript_20572:276-536(+)